MSQRLRTTLPAARLVRLGLLVALGACGKLAPYDLGTEPSPSGSFDASAEGASDSRDAQPGLQDDAGGTTDAFVGSDATDAADTGDATHAADTGDATEAIDAGEDGGMIRSIEAGSEAATALIDTRETLSTRPMLSADGHYVVFKSSTALVTGLDAGASSQVYRRDLQSGNIDIVSLDQSGAPATGLIWNDPMGVSSDGRYVAFTSYRMSADITDSADRMDVYLRDMTLGTTELASLGVDGTAGNGYSLTPSLSDDGRYLAFTSRATPTGPDHVFVRDLQLGTTVVEDLAFDGSEANNSAGTAYVSGNGRYVAFSSEATNLLAEPTSAYEDVFVRDLSTGTLVQASLGPAGCGDGAQCEGPSLSADGHYVAFYAWVSGSTFFRRDLQTGEVLPAEVSYDGSPVSEGCIDTPPVMSADGRYLAFSSCAHDLVPDDTDDVYVRDFVAATTVAMSVTLANRGTGFAYSPSISADGSLVAFTLGSDIADIADIVVRSRLAP